MRESLVLHVQVLLARIVESGELVAIKKISIRGGGSKTGIPDNILREILALKSLCHPNIVKLLDAFPKVHYLRVLQFRVLLAFILIMYPFNFRVTQSSSFKSSATQTLHG